MGVYDAILYKSQTKVYALYNSEQVYIFREDKSLSKHECNRVQKGQTVKNH